MAQFVLSSLIGVIAHTVNKLKIEKEKSEQTVCLFRFLCLKHNIEKEFVETSLSQT